MKNHIIKICVVVVATLLSFSCNDEFLEKYPLDEISNSDYWKTETHLAVYNNGLYDLARNDDNVPIFMDHDDGFDSQKYGIWYLDGYSDNTAPRHARGLDFQVLRAGKQTVPNTAGAQWFGYKGWNFLRAINVGLDNYGTADVSEEIRNKYIGEARLMRGWFYADKVSKFGNVQWVDRELNIDDEDILYGERDSRQMVMANALEDLNFAATNLPDDWGDGNAPGRINRWGALLVKSRVCLFEGTWRKYHTEAGFTDADMWLTEARDAALELINEGPYSLYVGAPGAEYNELHRMTDVTGNPEVIYWRRYDAAIFPNHVQNYHRGYVGGATKDMVEDYLCTDGKPITTSALYMGDEVYENIFANRDPRLRQTILYPEDQAIYNYGNHDFATYTYPRIDGMAGGQSSTTGYHIIKVFEADAAYRSYNASWTPAITMRFAEALLNYAEAAAELGTLGQGELDASINLLRDRVGMPHLMMDVEMDPKYANLGVSALISEIRRERRIELFMEGFRYFDLMRWKQGLKLTNKDYGMRWDDANKARFDPDGKATIKVGDVNGIPYLEIYKGTDYENPTFDESRDYLWPIPTDVISQNPNIGQNPNW